MDLNILVWRRAVSLADCALNAADSMNADIKYTTNGSKALTLLEQVKRVNSLFVAHLSSEPLSMMTFSRWVKSHANAVVDVFLTGTILQVGQRAIGFQAVKVVNLRSVERWLTLKGRHHKLSNFPSSLLIISRQAYRWISVSIRGLFKNTVRATALIQGVTSDSAKAGCAVKSFISGDLSPLLIRYHGLILPRELTI